MPRTTDPQDMHGAITAFPDHLEEGWRRGEAAESFGLGGPYSGLVICGMGGSAMGLFTAAMPLPGMPY